MRTIQVKTYIMHRMRHAIDAMSDDDNAEVGIGNTYIHTDNEIHEEIRVRANAWNWTLTYEGTYGTWKGEYEQGQVKKVKPINGTAFEYYISKETVTGQ